MKYLLIALVLIFNASLSYAQTPPRGEKENPFAKEYEKQGKKMTKPADSTVQNNQVVNAPVLPNDIDSTEMRFLAEYIQNPDISIGIFDLPGEMDPIRTLANGRYPETDDAYLELAINMSIMKFNTIDPIKGQFDSMIFLKMPILHSEHDADLTFYPFPSTRWLLFVKKGITKSASGQTEVNGWVNNLKNDVSTYSFLTDKTAFLFASAYYGNYSLKWNSTEDMPNGIVKVDEKFVSDLKAIVAVVSSMPPGTDKQVFNTKIETLRAGLKTDKAKYLCLYLKP
jgi:hypothetical protein